MKCRQRNPHAETAENRDVPGRWAIVRAREDGASWSDIGDALGVTKQAAWASYNDDVRDVLAAARGHRGLSDEESQQLADEARSERRRGTSAR